MGKDEVISAIRNLLDDLAVELERPAAREVRVSGLELPDVIRDVVDLLLPQLKPYEVALYMYMLRHSIVENGSSLVRISRRRLTKGVVKSAYSDRKGRESSDNSSSASYRSIQVALEGLLEVGAIRQEADPNREGTLYRVLLPDDIEACAQARKERVEEIALHPINEATEADFYNVKQNRIKIYERDNYHCVYCNKQLTRFTATLDHVHAVAEGGDNSFGNLVTACLECNARKNIRSAGDFLAERGT